MDDHLREAFRRFELDANLAPFPIPVLVGGGIAKHILVSKLGMDQVDVVIQLVKIIGKEGSPSGESDNVLNLSAAITKFPFLTDGINLHIGFLGKLSNFRDRITAAVVFSVRNEDQGLLLIFGGLDLFETQIHGVVEGCPPARVAEGNGVLDGGALMCEGLD